MASNPVGRPTKYSPEVNDICIKLMREGASIKEIAYELNVSRDTIYEWQSKYADFSDTIKKCVDFSEGWWMKQGRLNIDTKEFNSTLWYMNMRNRFGWADRQSDNQNPQETLSKIQALVADLNKTNESEI